MTQAQLARMDAAALNRAFLGFDRIFNNFENRFANQINTNYPPFNIERDGDTYAITLAVAGFEKEEISVSVDLICKTIFKIIENTVKSKKCSV